MQGSSISDGGISRTFHRCNDAEKGSNYNYYRDYDPSIGRYVESDPIGLEDGTNIYAYSGGNSLRYADRIGLCKLEVRCNLLSAGPLLGRKYSHCFLVTTDPDGSQTYYRGGPSGNGGSFLRALWNSKSGSGVSGDSGYGNIATNSGAHQPDSIDWPGPSTPETGRHTYVDNDLPCTCLGKQLNRSLDAIGSSNTPYNPLTTNSNAVAAQALSDAGINPGDAPALAPGWGVKLPGAKGGTQCCAQVVFVKLCKLAVMV